jgi:metal-dependent hydrolase (beta-lactamase superfamily II)
VEAIKAHSSRGSEANKVIGGFHRLKAREQQDIINFLRSL